MKMEKVVCEECGSSFPLERVKDMKTCVVCGKPLWNDSIDGIEKVDNLPETMKNQNEFEDGVMYFDEIATSYKECPELNGVRAYCCECGKSNSLALNLFDQFVDKEYVVLKNDVLVKCRGCNKEHKPRKILYKKKEHYTSLLPHCPICNSTMLKKIKTSSKILAAATLGKFALPYNSKTYECQNCNYRF